MSTVACCPACGSTRYKVRTSQPRSKNKHCRSCGTDFGEAAYREAESDHGVGSMLAAKLLEANPDDVGGAP